MTDLAVTDFPIRRLLLDAGFPHANEGSYAIQLQRFGIAQQFEAVWAAVEPLVLTLVLAGWRVPELAIGRTGVAGTARLWVHASGCVYDQTDFQALTGIATGTSAATVTALRVLVPRTQGAPSLAPPIALDGVPGYRRAPDPADRLADPLDGWLGLADGSSITSPIESAAKLLVNVRTEVAKRLAAAWDARDDGRAVGVLRQFDPVFWDSPRTRGLPLDHTQAVASVAIGTLEEPVAMAAFLNADADDSTASLRVLTDEGAEIAKARDELRARAASFHPRNQSLLNRLNRFGRRHWALELFSLHHYGLVRILPFPLAFEVGIPYADVTGFYESAWDPADESPDYFTMQLNQAGGTLEGFWVDELLQRWDIAGEPTAWTQLGPDEVSVTVTLTGADGGQTAQIRGLPVEAGADVAPVVHVGLLDHAMVRVDADAAASLAQGLLTASGEPSPTAESHLLRLHSHQALRISQAIDRLAAAVDPLIEGDMTLDDVELMLYHALNDEQVLVFALGAVPKSPVLDRFSAEARFVLSRTHPTAAAAEGRTAWDQLLILITDANLKPTDTLPALLGLDDPTAEQHSYTYQFANVGAGVDLGLGLGGALGSFVTGGPLSHDATCTGGGSAGHGWDDWVLGRTGAGGLSAGGEAKGQIMLFSGGDDNPLWTTHLWQPDDFAHAGGWDFAHTAFVSGSAGFGVGYFMGAGAKATFEPLEGYVFYSSTGPGYGWGHGTSKGIQVGIGESVGFPGELAGGGVFGVLDRRSGSAKPITQRPPVAPLEVVETRTAEDQVTFAFDSAMIDSQARDRIAKQVARYRVLLEQPGATLVVEGDSSPPGTDRYNETLSWKRAQALCALLRTLLTAGDGHALGIGSGDIVLVPYGELQARAANVGEHVPDPTWQRAKFVLKGTLMVLG